MKKSRVFSMDTRNIGGREAILVHMFHHQCNLREIKSEIPSSGKARRKKKKGGRLRSKTDSSFCSEPDTYHLVKKLSKHRKAHEDRMAREHQRRQEEMKRRIEEYPTPFQRRQNQFDPLGHPPLFVRYTAPASTPEYDYASGPPKELFYADPYHPSQYTPIAQGPPAPPAPGGLSHTSKSSRPTSRRGHPSGRRSSQQTRSTRPQSAQGHRPSRGGIRTKASGKKGNRPLSALGRRPNSKAKERVDEDADVDPYLKLKKHLFELIVEHRIFRESDLNALFEKARGLNTHLNQDKVEQVIQDLRLELHVETDGGDGAAGDTDA